jgi:hypothetical protein
MTIQDIIDSVTEQDSYRRDAEIKRRIAEWAVLKLPALRDGYERTITGVDYEAGEATYADALIADRLAAEAAQAVTNEAQRQLDKPLQLKIYENQYLGICQQLGGVGKLGFDELQARITSLMAQDKDTAVMLTLQLLTLDAAGKREGGLKWWDDIAYHAEIVK